MADNLMRNRAPKALPRRRGPAATQPAAGQAMMRATCKTGSAKPKVVPAGKAVKVPPMAMPH